MKHIHAALPSITSFSVVELRDSIKQMEWLNYEVAPEWQRFCSFGPEDMGSVWEEIGAIRRRPTISRVIVSEEMAKRMNKIIEEEVLFRPTGYGVVSGFGIPMHVSPYLKGVCGFLVKGDSV